MARVHLYMSDGSVAEYKTEGRLEEVRSLLARKTSLPVEKHGSVQARVGFELFVRTAHVVAWGYSAR